jgi:ATP synthase protein I
MEPMEEDPRRPAVGGANRREEQLARALHRDLQRRQRRDSSHRTFWRWLGVLGMVGWPFAITTVGGAWLGHYLDTRLGTGIQFTLLLMVVGLALGSTVVWQVFRRTEE